MKIIEQTFFNFVLHYYAKYLLRWRAAYIYQKMFRQKLSIQTAKNIKNKIIKLDKILHCIKSDLYNINKKMHGKFYYEFIPTLKLAQKLQAHSISLIEDEQLRFDAKLVMTDETIQKVEWVTAMDH
tara:strand:+ start:37953 stop:38330 length:378 start_codon:yes stop_codon:yes gene_type:complete